MATFKIAAKRNPYRRKLTVWYSAVLRIWMWMITKDGVILDSSANHKIEHSTQPEALEAGCAVLRALTGGNRA